MVNGAPESSSLSVYSTPGAELLHFYYLTDEGFASLASDYNGDELGALLSKFLPATKYYVFKEALNSTKLALPSNDEMEIAKFALEQKTQTFEMFEGLRAIGIKPCYKPVNIEEIEFITQRQAGFSNSNAKFPILASQGAFGCTIIATYNPLSKTAAIAHIDPSISMNSVNSFIESIRSDGTETIELHILAADNTRNTNLMDLLKCITSLSNISIKSCHYYSPIMSSDKYYYDFHQLAIDARTGEIYTNFSEPDEQGRERLLAYLLNKVAQNIDANNLNLEIKYDGRLDPSNHVFVSMADIGSISNDVSELYGHTKFTGDTIDHTESDN